MQKNISLRVDRTLNKGYNITMNNINKGDIKMTGFILAVELGLGFGQMTCEQGQANPEAKTYLHVEQSKNVTGGVANDRVYGVDEVK